MPKIVWVNGRKYLMTLWPQWIILLALIAWFRLQPRNIVINPAHPNGITAATFLSSLSSEEFPSNLSRWWPSFAYLCPFAGVQQCDIHRLLKLKKHQMAWDATAYKLYKAIGKLFSFYKPLYMQTKRFPCHVKTMGSKTLPLVFLKDNWSDSWVNSCLKNSINFPSKGLAPWGPFFWTCLPYIIIFGTEIRTYFSTIETTGSEKAARVDGERIQNYF